MSQAFFEPFVLSASSSSSSLSSSGAAFQWTISAGYGDEERGEKKDFDEIEWEMSRGRRGFDLKSSLSIQKGIPRLGGLDDAV